MGSSLIIDNPRAEGVAWFSHEAFVADDVHGGPCPEVIDITGQARVLLRSPSLALTPGRWRATVHFELCQDAARRFLALEFGVPPDIAVLDLPRGVFGPQVARLDYSTSAAGPAQLSLRLKKPAFHGYIKVLGMSLEDLTAVCVQSR